MLGFYESVISIGIWLPLGVVLVLFEYCFFYCRHGFYWDVASISGVTSILGMASIEGITSFEGVASIGDVASIEVVTFIEVCSLLGSGFY